MATALSPNVALNERTEKCQNKYIRKIRMTLSQATPMDAKQREESAKCRERLRARRGEIETGRTYPSSAAGNGGGNGRGKALRKAKERDALNLNCQWGAHQS
ncbi:unnamed protein product [Ceratitis capitata]|uniref:(Mediterranean fruit fly) hypothetical protein n=1 Tax=Ceratitis capitata TaxID=7213 RepID=A0A811U3U4_CERCA|nr:unnamed protein product [Ceratitis capitata]